MGLIGRLWDCLHSHKEFKMEKIIKLQEEIQNKKQFIRNAYKKFGRMFEQFVPFTKRFSQEDKENFKFLGQPIDGIIFGKNEITFVEIKTGKSQLTENQKRVRNLIQQKKINFWEVRFS